MDCRMTIVIAIPLFICLLGAVLFFAGQGKWSLLGERMFTVGLLVTLFAATSHPLVLR